MLSDTRLAAEVQRAGKTGLQYCEQTGKLRMIGAGWALETWRDFMEADARKTLAKLVEMLGRVPTDCCMEIQKSKDGYLEQTLVQDAFDEAFGWRTQQTEPRVCKRTALQFGGARLYQTRAGRIVGVSAELLGLVGELRREDPTVDARGTSLRWENDGVILTLEASQPDRERDGDRMDELWTALEREQWCVWEGTE